MYLTYPVTEGFPPRFSSIGIHNRKSNMSLRFNGSHQLYDILKRVYLDHELRTIWNPNDACSGDIPEILISKFGKSLNFITGKGNSRLCAKQNIRFFIYNSQFPVTTNKVGILHTICRERLCNSGCKNKLCGEFSDSFIHSFILSK